MHQNATDGERERVMARLAALSEGELRSLQQLVCDAVLLQALTRAHERHQRAVRIEAQLAAGTPLAVFLVNAARRRTAWRPSGSA